MNNVLYETLCQQLAAVAKWAPTLGPIDDLTQELWASFNFDSLANMKATMEQAQLLHEKILAILDQPKHQYDDEILEFYRMLKEIPDVHRVEARSLVASPERRALRPYLGRADWLAIEEKSCDRLASGIVIFALIASESDDRRDLM